MSDNSAPRVWVKWGVGGTGVGSTCKERESPIPTRLYLDDSLFDE